MKHVHHNLIVKWLEDISTKFQIESLGQSEVYFDCNIHRVIAEPNRKFRIKPREFVKGHWYPCINENTEPCVYMWNGNSFVIDGSQLLSGDLPEEMIDIGKSLGEIKFGE